ncbi:MAG TPA: membrane protein insertase YidC, partial [Polyangiaceae bacterium]|nr:membrane protein insertase YidC [Polyangiaceae bacterium]
MERAGLSRWLLIGLAVFLALQFLPGLFGGGSDTQQPLALEGTRAPEQRKPERYCDIWTGTYRAQLSTRSASLKRFELLTAKYKKAGQPIDLSTTPDVENRRQLLFHWRNEAVAGAKDPNWQVDYDLLDYDLVRTDGSSCEFQYRDEKVEITKTISATPRPYELEVRAVVKNLSQGKLRHALSVHTTAWRKTSEVEGKMFTVSPFITHVECVLQNGDTTRLNVPDFEPDKFKKPEFTRGPVNPGDWFQVAGAPDGAAISNAYFSHAVLPKTSPKPPTCQLQIEERWDSSHGKKKSADPNNGAMYRARLAYPVTELAAGQTVSYSVQSYIGPKERNLLAAAGGGGHNTDELIDLGFFSAIAKVLVAFLLQVYSVIPNWGIAIIILTITARLLLFPLSVPSIKSMIKMRELKPHLDAMNEKYKDDAQAKGLAQMELWRKHNVNPLKGCLPQLASMPVWFALYTTLQTAVELYNIPFLWFPDLSRPDPYYILPFIIGATSFMQQKIMPMQGDPMQQKMMMYFMPAMFTVFMLFLPAGLGVYMFTNGVLGIVQ